MKRLILAALTASALTSPALAQRTAPPMPATVDPQVAQLRDAALKDDVAWDIIEGLTTEVGQRLAGTEAEARARTWAVTKLTALGFKNVRVEPYRMPVWERGAETAEILAPFPQKLTLAALGNSGATPAGGLTGEVAVFPSMAAFQSAPDDAVRGKIIYIGNAMPRTQDGSGYGAYGTARFVGPALASQRGAAAIIIRSIGTDHHRFPHTGTTDFPAGVKPIPAAALSVPDAEQLERIAARGAPIRMKLVLTPRQVGMRESGNVIAEVPGSDPSAGIVLVGGHLDSWDLGTGAIDDASGIAITAAAAKRIMDAGQPRRTIRVVWFGAEEVGGLGGAAYARAHAGERHATASESDFGADRVWRVEVNLPPAAKPVADRLQTALAPLGITRGSGPGGDGTDIGPTLKLGTAAIDLNQSGWDYFDTHHTPDDVIDRIDPAALRQNVAAWTTMLAVVANAPEAIDAVKPR
ncbi:M20/M25/M40 family metallo-hydrolase [Sphingomonas sanguinis]|uniref:Carboxypeptidase Q n=1 Tax=Sphingomonas sanguinis TaxID=33051 RepID=A0A147I4N2_9SPHN|nr:M20/M25/M40 family metallo-hydrolase [Sphingomonas sanguinis]KTT73356.1 peptidase M28 [Sphingomonas sanguinis]